ncbi:MAG TPA: hypothetical protein VIY48_06540 [Candidatus Paceibacterota bacterium]
MTTKVTVTVPDYIPLVRVFVSDEKDGSCEETVLNGGDLRDFHIWDKKVITVREDLE